MIEGVTPLFESVSVVGLGKVGELVAERAKKAGFDDVVFDRGGSKYAGRVAAIAEGAREGGLNL